MPILAATVEVDYELLTFLTELFGIESEQDALDLALRRLADILEIELLNEDSDDAYWPAFEPIDYVRGGSAHEA